MTEDSPIAKTLNDILQTQSFERLGKFADHEVWNTLSQDERKLLATLFVMAGESELKAINAQDPVNAAKKSFNMASTLSPDDAMIWYRRAIAFSTHDAQSLLEESSLCLEKAVLLDDSYFDAWYAWGNVLMRRAVQVGEANLFGQAEEKFQKAELLLQNPERSAEFYWHFGLTYFMMGRQSGEAFDLHRAILCYRKAKDQNLLHYDFYNDYANALVELSLLINCQEMMFEAIELYLYSLDAEDSPNEKAREMAVRYCNLGACYQYLFEFHHEETFFKQAQECFLQATELQPQFGNAWAFWGYLLLYAAKLWQDAQYLEGCLDKLSRLSDFASDKPLLLARMAEAFAFYGSHEEDLKFLTDAEEIAETAVQQGAEVPYTWASLALVNLELGRYFGEEMYFQEAIDKAERGIALNLKIGMCWHVLAVAKFSLGESRNDLQLMEEACVAFNFASKTDVGRFGYMWNDWGIALLNLADSTHEKKHVQDAIEKFEQGILLHEHVNPSWLVNYGSALDFWGDVSDDESYYEKAVEVLNHAINLDPQNVQARYHLGLAYCHQGELNNDLHMLQKGIEQLQTVLHEDIEDDTAWNDLGTAFLHVAELTQDPIDIEVKQSLYELAEQHFLQALSLGSQHVYYNLACLYSLQENVPDAFHYLVKAYENHALPSLADLMEDRWLEHLRATGHFQQFLSRVQGSPDVQ